ncbi:MAG: imidazolonepropionase [Bacteroidota bacterium]|nr:imidazolonepropionase [Bacteroidota bacterium]
MQETLLLRNIGILTGIQPSHVKRLSGKEMSTLTSIENAYLLSDNGVIRNFGPEAECIIERADEIIDCTGRIVLPAYCDSHTHLVFAAWRENEFVDRIHGLTYEEIARRGGGILNSAARLQQTSEEDLYDSALARLHDVMQMGTGAIEIKSGYGLNLESELKMLRVIRRLKEQNLIPIKSTFLGAHAMPLAYKTNRQEYIRVLIEEMLPAIHQEGLADYIDVFCDVGFYTVDETDKLLEAGARYGLKPKIHANELDYSGGIQVGVKHKAISVDHLEYTGPEEIETLANSATMATILPSTAFFLGLPYAPARNMIEGGLAVSLATDFNPGSSPGGNPSFILSLGCIKLKMTPEESINALTINGAAAMELQDHVGSITPSKSANLIITKAASNVSILPYHFSHNWVDKVIISGKVI